MKLSKKSDYALRALVTLTEQLGSGPISIRKLSEQNDVPQRFLEQIMLDLKRGGWVQSVAGRDGGFLLAKSPELISMGEVVRHFDDVLAPIACVSASHYEPCSQEQRCRFRRVLLEIRNFTALKMDQMTLEQIARRVPVRPEEVFSTTFISGDGI